MWYHRLLNALRPDRLSRDLDREMAFHLAERADQLRDTGLGTAEAAREARRRFGNPTAQKERTHDVDALVWLESLGADVRYALRALRASPGFAAVAILSLALGIGANTAIFSLTNALVLRALPVSHPEQLVQVTRGEGGGGIFTNPLWERIRERHDILSGMFAYGDERFNLATGGEARYAAGAWVGGAIFDVLGVRMVAGRPLHASDDVRGCPAVAVVSGGFADRELGGAAAAVGRLISLGGHPFQVVGVSDPAFFGMEVGVNTEIYAPLCALAVLEGPKVLDQRSRWYLLIFGRPAPGLTLQQVQARLAAAAPGIARATLPSGWGTAELQEYLKTTLSARPGAGGFSDVRMQYQRALYTLMAVVGLVLLIACANIANLLLARAAGREREIAIRVAIGAGRARVLRQLLTESVLLSVAGAAVGLLFARWAAHLIVATLNTGRNAVSLDLSLDPRVLAFTVVVATATGILFGIAPAWRAARVDPQVAMKSGGRGTVGAGRHRAGAVLVAGQLAVSLALVAAAGLLLGSFRTLATFDPGFRRDGVLVASMDFGRAGIADSALPATQRAILRRLRALPRVLSASASFTTPVSGMGWNQIILVPGHTVTDRMDALAFLNEVSDGYFATTGTALVGGRDFTPDRSAGAPRVAIINETMARKFFGTVNPIGRSFSLQEGDTAGPPMAVIGVVRDSKYGSLTEKPQAIGYVPLGQSGVAGANLRYELRTSGDPAALVPAVRSLAASESPRIALEFRTIAQDLADSMARPRLLATLSGFFGALALLLAVVGLYGTMAYGVVRRRNELGVRIALGATRGRIVGMVTGEAGRIVAAGVLLGVGLALASTRLLASFLFRVTPTDAATLTGAAGLLALSGLAAALVPAWRAARADPVEALREE